MPLDRSTTDRPHAAIRYALAGWFADPDNRLKSNREAARVLRVDESTVRLYRIAHGIPALLVGSGKPADEPQPKGRRKPAKRKKPRG
jgi:hypothetical protein